MKGSNNGPVIVPGNANGSLLIWKLEGVTESGADVSGKRMPVGKAPLDAATIQWIKDLDQRRCASRARAYGGPSSPMGTDQVIHEVSRNEN